MSNEQITVTFVDATMAQKNILAEDLRADLLGRGVTKDALSVTKESSSTQDAGTILTVILSSGAVLALAKGLAIFAAKSASKISIKLPSGESILITGDAATKDNVAETVAAALRSHSR